jgi:membrane fusion protein (multidrug efflux system)
MKKLSISLLVAVLLLGGGYLFKKWQAMQALESQRANAANSKALQIIELLESDISTVEKHTLNQTLPINGTIKATQLAAIKAKVSGDITQVFVKEGEAVKSGQILAQIDTAELASRVAEREANLNQSQAQLAMADRSLSNNKALVEKGFISTSALETSQDTLAVNRAQVRAIQQQLVQARKTLKDAAVTSPMDGVITEKLVSAGEKVSPDIKLFSVVQPNSLEFEAALNPQDAAQLKPGVPLQLSGAGIEAVTATVVRINAAVNSGSRTVSIYAVVPPGSAFKSGQFATGIIRLAGKEGVTVVPVDAVRDEGGRQVVYALSKDSRGETLQVQAVKPGLRGELSDGRMMLEVTGLEPGVRIIGKNLGPLRTGVPLRISAGPTPKVVQ